MPKKLSEMTLEELWQFDMSKDKDLIVQNGYICMAEKAQRISFHKGYTENGLQMPNTNLYPNTPKKQKKNTRTGTCKK